MASPAYGPFGKHLMTIIDGALTMHHANFSPHPPTAVLGTAAPVTEVLTAYFEKENDGFDAKVKKLFGIISDNTAAFKAGAGGWVVEDVEFKGKKAKAYVGLLGWESVEAHVSFRENQAFKDNIQLLRQDPLGLEVHHTKFIEK